MKRCIDRYFLAAGISLFCLAATSAAIAQIIPDTAPDRNLGTTVFPLNPQIDAITGGTRPQNGINLFHSFSEFDVLEGRAVFFVNPVGVENILSRVTGNNPSNIFGILGVLGNANLFLINPRGIIFGSNARLDIGGSFVGTTANAVLLGNTGRFSASEPETSSLLTVTPSALFFNALASQAEIVNRSRATGFSNNTGQPTFGLQVPSGRSLALVGGNVSLDGGLLIAQDGRVELGGLTDSGIVTLSNLNSGSLRLTFPDNVQRADVSLNNGAGVGVVARGSGSIGINARNLQLSGASLISAGIDLGLVSVGTLAGDIEINATGGVTVEGRSSIANLVNPGAFGTSGNIIINAQTLNLSRLGQVVTGIAAASSGQGGNINIKVESLSVTDGGAIGSNTFGNGNAGNVRIDANSITVGGVESGLPARIRSVVDRGAVGNSGDVTIQTGKLSIQSGGQILTSVLGQGQGGTLALTATDTVEVVGRSADGQFPSSLSTETQSNGTAGGLRIATGNLSVRDGAVLSTSSFGQGREGNLEVTASNVELVGTSRNGQSPSVLRSSTASAADAGNITIVTNQLSLRDGAAMTTGTLGNGRGGNITITASESVELSGASATDSRIRSGIFSGTVSNGNAGNLTINTQRVSIRDGAFVGAGTSSSGEGGTLAVTATESIELSGTTREGRYRSALNNQTEGIGKAGDTRLVTKRLSLQNGAQVSTSSLDRGQGGNLEVYASESIDLFGNPVHPLVVGSNLTSEAQASGAAGTIRIFTGNLRLRDGAVVSARTFGAGQGGSLEVNASKSIEIVGTLANELFPSSLSTETFGSSKAGDLRIITETLSLRDGGRVSASAYSDGAGGNLEVRALDSVEVLGASPNGLFASGLFATTVGNGAAGNLTIETGELLVRDRAAVSVSSAGTKKAGDINVAANSIQLDRGLISALTLASNGGNITLNVQDLLLMRHNSEISTSAGTAQQGGDGGNITINSPFIVAVPKENSDITANAFTGNGGNINITTQGIYGLQFRPRRTPKSDITASSDFGVNGTVLINSAFDVTQSVTNLPVDLVDASDQIDQTCTPVGAEKREKNRFIITGRGGLPPNPNEPLQGESVITNWVTIDPQEEQQFQNTSSTKNRDRVTIASSASSAKLTVVEAQSWVYGANGEVILTAHAPTVTPHSFSLTPASCNPSSSELSSN
jgi:filamentous hemagglutinin family protein